MAEEDKNFGDKAEDAFDAAKEKAKEFGEDAKEAAKDLGDKAEDVFESAKDKTKEFADSAKEAFDSSNPDSGKNIAIISHLTPLGWIIALIMNKDKSELGSFYIRQVLGIWILGFLLGLIPLLNLIAWVIPLALWIMSLIGAFGESKKPVMIVGDLFQDWFKSL